ncbi:MAG: hypothetical protein CALGDGBN_02518 [Pseudomonadales bacterium]|nr:hypothetical protein [Pseudomonadales bacterium]
MQRVAVREQQQVSDVRVGHQRVASESDREPGVAGGHAWQPLGGERRVAAAREQRRTDQHGVDQRFGQRHVAHFLGEQHEIEFAHAESAVLLGDGEPGETEPGELRPEFVRTAGRRLPRGADALGRDLGGEEFAHRALEQTLVFAETEIHLPSPYARGMPSMRWAMMLRWISLAPA